MDDKTTLVNRLHQYIGKASFSHSADQHAARSLLDEIIAQRDSRIEELELALAEQKRITLAQIDAHAETRDKLAALKAQPSGVVPDRDGLVAAVCVLKSRGLGNLAGAVADALEVLDSARLKSSPASAGGVDERAAFEAWASGNVGPLDKVTPCDQTEPWYIDSNAKSAWRAWQARAALNAGSAVPDAWRDVQAERQRQISAEGWTPEHDDTHCNYPHELSIAAACYALCASGEVPHILFGVERFPWPGKGNGDGGKGPSTKGGPRRMLVKAGALILAEIERLDRAAPAAKKEG